MPYVTGREIQYLQEVIDSGQFAGNGSFTKRCQQLLEERYEIPHVLLTHSCTGALELAALILDTGPGDEVIVPSYTFAATASAFLRTGAKIVFCEVDPATMNVDVADIERLITTRTKAIVPVHYGGIGAEMEALAATVAGRPITLVEDAAQGLEAKIGDNWLGTIAPLGTMSFHETKNVHAGLSGALFVNDAALNSNISTRTSLIGGRSTPRTTDGFAPAPGYCHWRFRKYRHSALSTHIASS